MLATFIFHECSLRLEPEEFFEAFIEHQNIMELIVRNRLHLVGINVDESARGIDGAGGSEITASARQMEIVIGGCRGVVIGQSENGYVKSECPGRCCLDEDKEKKNESGHGQSVG